MTNGFSLSFNLHHVCFFSIIVLMSLDYTYDWGIYPIVISWEHANLLLIFICTAVQINAFVFVIWNE